MTDLAELFDSVPTRRRGARGGQVATGVTSTIDTSNLETVFSDDAAPLHERPGPDIVAGLAEMLADRPVERTPVAVGVDRVDDIDDLRALVGPSVPVSTAVVTGAPGPARTHRSRARRDGVAITAAVVAIAAVLAAVAVVAGVVFAKPVTSDALRALSRSEALLVDRTEALNTRISALSSRHEARMSRAEELQGSLAAMAHHGDETARLAAEAERQEYVRALEEIDIPTTVPHYRRDAIDTTSLDDVAAAMNATQVRMIELDRTAEQLGRAEDALVAAGEDLGAALAAFTGTVPAAAEAVVAESPDAEEPFRAAVVQAAADVAGGDPVTRAGLETWAAYIAAVAALRADQQRALDVIAAERELVVDEGYWIVYPDPVPSPSTPVEPEPVDPAPVDPDPTVPVDPVPTEPVDPDPQGE